MPQEHGKLMLNAIGKCNGIVFVANVNTFSYVYAMHTNWQQNVCQHASRHNGNHIHIEERCNEIKWNYLTEYYLNQVCAREWVDIIIVIIII